MKKYYIFIISLVAFVATTMAQDKVKAEISADFVSSYHWRGQELGEASVQPDIDLYYKGFNLSAWGSVGLKSIDPLKEIDLMLAYSNSGFNISVTDYWTTLSDGKFFCYDSHSTSHVFEANVGYDFGILSLQWYTIFAGADGVNKSDKRAYSSFMEAKAPFNLGGLKWEATIGATPYATTYYAKADGFSVTDISLQAAKDIKITEGFSIPLFAAVHANPSTEKLAVVVGFTLQPQF